MTVSVVIPAYNAQDHIARAIDSVLAQTLLPEQIIVVDDGSGDNTSEVVKAYGEKVTYIHQENSGAGATRNTGIEAASSEWIAFLDSDDQWLPDKLRLQTDLLGGNPDLVWAYSNCFLNYQSRNDRFPMLDITKAKSLLNGRSFFDNYLKAQAAGFPAWTGTVIAKRDAVMEVGMFDPDLPLAQDIDLWFRLAYKHPAAGYIPIPLAVYNTETPNSNVKRFTDISHICNIIDRHLSLSAEQNCRSEFQQCIYPIVHDWILKLSTQRRHHDMLALLNRYRNYLPRGYYLRKKIRALFPAPVACYNKLAAKLKGK